MEFFWTDILWTDFILPKGVCYGHFQRQIFFFDFFFFSLLFRKFFEVDYLLAVKTLN